MDLPLDFRDLLAEFESGRVEFLLVGGYAVAFHGRPRATKDIDLLLEGKPDNLRRAAEALARFGAPPNVIAAVTTLKDDEIVFLGQPPLRIDLLRSIDGVDSETLFRNAIRTVIDGVPLRVISLDDLIANKAAADRPQDRLDRELLLRVRRGDTRA